MHKRHLFQLQNMIESIELLERVSHCLGVVCKKMHISMGKIVPLLSPLMNNRLIFVSFKNLFSTQMKHVTVCVVIDIE